MRRFALTALPPLLWAAPALGQAMDPNMPNMPNMPGMPDTKNMQGMSHGAHAPAPAKPKAAHAEHAVPPPPEPPAAMAGMDMSGHGDPAGSVPARPRLRPPSRRSPTPRRPRRRGTIWRTGSTIPPRWRRRGT